MSAKCNHDDLLCSMNTCFIDYIRPHVNPFFALHICFFSTSSCMQMCREKSRHAILDLCIGTTYYDDIM